jgi:NAD-dependent deacetylase
VTAVLATSPLKYSDVRLSFDADPLVQSFLSTQAVPLCTRCSTGRLKHATISFGQMLPDQVLQRAIDWCRKADLIFAIGSSLVVTPAANLPLVTKQSGGRLVIINRDATPLDEYADLVVNAGIGETLGSIDARLADC